MFRLPSIFPRLCSSLRCLGILLLAGAPLATRAAGGVVNLVSQNRFVDVNTSMLPLPQEDQRQAAADFDVFDQSVTLSFMPPVGFAMQTASQTSTLDVTADGAVFAAHGSIGNHPVGESGLNAESFFQVNFDVTSPAPYLLDFSASQGGRAGVTFVPGFFTGPTAPGTVGVPNPTPIQGGLLEPGAYQFKTSITSDGSFDLNLKIGSAVPLPPGVWAVLPVLPLLLAATRLAPRGRNARLG